MFKRGDRVKLTTSYDGYFTAFKGLTLTVKELVPKDPSIDGPALKIEEIFEVENEHLVLAKHFVRAESD